MKLKSTFANRTDKPKIKKDPIYCVYRCQEKPIRYKGIMPSVNRQFVGTLNECNKFIANGRKK